MKVKGIRLSSIASGIYPDRPDMVLIELAAGSQTVAAFTQNAFCAAPVQIAKKHLAQQNPLYLLINAGNANAGTGESGLERCIQTCYWLAAKAGVAINQILPFSTGVIGEDLPLKPFSQSIPSLLDRLNEHAWPEAARAIMTTDTRPKLIEQAIEWQGQRIQIIGMAKGSGMICPNMATLLAYVATDAQIEKKALQSLLDRVLADSFNAITVDGDTSTNDACVLIATGKSGFNIELDTEQGRLFESALHTVFKKLARSIIADAEGATKQVSIRVEQARNQQEAKQVAYTVAHSPLVKTALFASDPNWGRILAAVGRAGLSDLNIEQVQIYLGPVCIVRQGGRAPEYQESEAQSIMNQKLIDIRIQLGRGTAQTELLTCDLSYDYIRINAEYRS